LFALGRALAAECPHLAPKCPRYELPDLAVRGLAMFDKRLRTIVPELGHKKECSNDKAKEVLGLTFRDGQAAIRDAIRSLCDLGLI